MTKERRSIMAEPVMHAFVGAKVSPNLFRAFELRRDSLRLTKSEAVREAIRLFIENGSPRAVNPPSKGCKRDGRDLA